MLLELELEGELDGAGAADLVEGVEAAIGAAGAQAAGQCLRRMAEERIGQVIVGRAEVGVVEDVEELGSETKTYFLAEVKLALQRYIGLCGSEASKNVAPKISLLSRRSGGKCRLVEDFSTRILGAKKLQRHAPYKIGSWIQSSTVGKVDLADDVNGRRRSGENKTIQRPTAQGGADKCSSSGSGQIVGDARSERMTDVKI